MLLWLLVRWQIAFGVMWLHKRQVRGQGLVEYSLLLIFVVLVVVSVVAAIGETICAEWYAKIINNAAWGGATVSCSGGP